MENANKQIKVSVVIPVYNVEKYLDMCLQSVLAQTYMNYEVILVDDGSTDGSAAICDRYVSQNDQMKVIHQKNGGLSHARNVGVSYAKGEYIFFLDSDDCIHPELLQRIVPLAEESNASLVQIDIEEVPNEFDDYCKPLVDDYPLYHFSTIESLYNLEKDNQTLAHDIRLTSLVVWTKLYKKELFKNVSFPEDIKLHEDQMVAHRFIIESGGVLFYRAPLYYYRKRPKSLISEGWTIKRLIMFSCYEDRLQWIKKLSPESKEKKILIDYVYSRYLTCMFKNYWMATHKLTGSEKKECQNQIIKKYRVAIRNKEYHLNLKQRLIFHFFSHFPNVFTLIYDIAKHRKV